MDVKKSSSIDNVAINRAIDYIFENIDEDITVDDVAENCGYSKYHLTHMFKEAMDEALYQFIKRIRLERSAWRLKVEKEKSVTEIGANYGYSSSNFATAFKKHMEMSPIDFRKKSEQLVEESSFSYGLSLEDLNDASDRISIEHLQTMTVIYERKKGNYHDLSTEWCLFLDKYKDLASDNTVYIECTIDDPSITDQNECMYELCQTIDSDHPALKSDRNLMTHEFEGGKYAVYHFKGYPQLMFMVYQKIFCRWLSKTGNQLDDRPIFDIYRKIEEDGSMEIDICFPLA